MGKEAIDFFSTQSGQIMLSLLRNAVCPACDGSGAIQRQTSSREYVTREMARDAGDPSMEGSLYRDDEFEVEQCQWCYEREAILSEADGKTGDASSNPKEILNLLRIGLEDETDLSGTESQDADENQSWQQESGIGNIGAIEESEITNGSEEKRLNEVAATVTSETLDVSTSIISAGKLNASATSSAKAGAGFWRIGIGGRGHKMSYDPEIFEKCSFGKLMKRQCTKDAKWISTFNGKDCRGESGALIWCDEHKPITLRAPHGLRKLA